MSDQPEWRTIIRRIRSGKFLPIISDRISSPGSEKMLASWAKEIGFPFSLDHNASLAQVAQFLSATTRDDLTAKEDYLEFAKNHLLDEARENATAELEGVLETLEDEIFDLAYSDVAGRLGHPRYENVFDNPLRILAELPLPIFITTSSHEHMETALRDANKQPRSEICYWSESLDYIPSIFEGDDPYEPTVENPVVFHLHGLDRHPSSLVLTEDDYLDFLVKVSEDPEAVPLRIRQALVDSSLLLLGYELADWDFKVVFRGLIKTKRDSRRRFSLSIQMNPDEDGDAAAKISEVQEYLEKYFGKANFDIYWGDAVKFSQELWQQWEEM